MNEHLLASGLYVLVMLLLVGALSVRTWLQRDELRCRTTFGASWRVVPYALEDESEDDFRARVWCASGMQPTGVHAPYPWPPPPPPPRRGPRERPPVEHRTTDDPPGPPSQPPERIAPHLEGLPQ